MKRARSWWVLLATIAGVGVTCSAGWWQLGRAEQKQRLFDTMMARQQQAALDNATLPCDLQGWREVEQRTVSLRGRWLSERTIFLDNRSMDGRAGFVVLTPLRLEPPVSARCGAAVLLVQRGWVPRDPYERTRVPPVHDSAMPVRVLARLVPPPSRLMELSMLGPEHGAIRQNVDLSALSGEWGVALLPGSAQQLEADSPAAASAPEMLRHWWQPSADVGKHQAYAVQWFAMALIMMVLYVWLQWWRPRQALAERSMT